MKIIAASNHDLETYAQYFVAENIPTKELANDMCKGLNEKATDSSLTYYRVVEDDYKLWRGMEDLI